VALFLAELAYDLAGLVSDWNDSNNCWAPLPGQRMPAGEGAPNGPNISAIGELVERLSE